MWAWDLGLAPRHRQAFGRKLPPGQQRHMRSSSGRTCNLEPCCRCRCSNFQWRCSSYRSNCRGFCTRLIDQHELFGTRHRPSAGIDCCICLRTAYDRRDICRKPCNPKFVMLQKSGINKFFFQNGGKSIMRHRNMAQGRPGCNEVGCALNVLFCSTSCALTLFQTPYCCSVVLVHREEQCSTLNVWLLS